MKKYIATAALGAALTAGPMAAGTASAGTPDQNNTAMSQFSSTVGVATTTGALIGTGVGAAIGCAIGGGLTAPTVVFVPAGCLAGLVTGAGVGGVVGTLIVGGPTAVIAGVQMVSVLLTPAA